MQITGTHFNYYQLCKRKLWLFASGINMEGNSDLVYEGKLIHETSYPQRSEKYEEVEIDGVKVDYYDAKRKVIHEETFQHKSLGRKVSFRHLIKLECYKLAKDLLGIEDYKPFKMYW